MESNLISLRKSSRQRKTPAHLKIYECDLPLSVQTENPAAPATAQDQQVSDTQFPRSPKRPVWQLLDINDSSSPNKVLTPRNSTLASKPWPGPMKPSNAKFQADSSLHTHSQLPIPNKNPAQVAVSMSDSSPSIAVHHLVPKKEASDHSDLKDTIPHIPSPGTDIMKKSMYDFFCQICQASCSSDFTFNQHLKGRRHAANLKWSQERRNCSEGVTGNPRCDICQICCQDKVSLEMHLKGKKHMNKVHELELAEENAKKKVRCELCLVNCMNENAFQQHLVGKQHAARLELVRKGLK